MKTPLMTALSILAFSVSALAQEAPGAAGKPQPPDDRSYVVIAADTRELRSIVANCGVAIDLANRQQVEGVASPRSLECVRKAGLRIVKEKPLDSFDAKDFPPEDQTYHNVERMQKEFASITQSMPGASSVSSIGSTWQGRPIQVLSLGTQGKPGILLMGEHHAREHLSTEVPLGIATWLAANHKDPAVAHVLKNRAIYILPAVNPDGMEYDIGTGKYRWYRKNMRSNGDGSTGVDLNRNYDWDWGHSGSSTYPGADTYQGPEPFSEPESRAVRDFLKSHSNITVLVSYHSSGSEILYPWGHSYDPVPDAKDRAAFIAIAKKMGELTGYEAMQSSELYPSSGDTCDWAYGILKMFCITVELEGGGFYPGAGAIGPATDKNLKAALYLFDIADDPRRAASKEDVAAVHKADLDKATDGKVGSQSESDVRAFQARLEAAGAAASRAEHAPRSFDGAR